MRLIDTSAALVGSVGSLYVVREQEIPDDYLAELRSERLAKAHLRAGEMDRVASIPAQLFDIWCAQGRDPWRAEARELVGWLQREDLTAFITTPKAV